MMGFQCEQILAAAKNGIEVDPDDLVDMDSKTTV
jgi:hypothetical protein